MLAKVVEIRLRPSPFVVDSEDLGDRVFEVNEGFEDKVGLGRPFVRDLLEELPLSRLELLQYSSLEVGSYKQHFLEVLPELVRVKLEVGPKLGKEPLKVLPLGPVESRWRSDLSVPSGRRDRGLQIAPGLHIVQALLDSLERGDLCD